MVIHKPFEPFRLTDDKSVSPGTPQVTMECWYNPGGSAPRSGLGCVSEARGTSGSVAGAESQRRRGAPWGSLTWAHVLLLLHVRHVEAPQVHRGHAECELANGPSLSQPIREPGQVAVTVQVVGVEAPGRGRDRGKTCHGVRWGGCRWLSRAGQPQRPFAQHDSPSLSLCMTELPQEPRPFYCQVTDDSYLHVQATSNGASSALSNSPFLNSNSTLFFPTQGSLSVEERESDIITATVLVRVKLPQEWLTCKLQYVS